MYDRPLEDAPLTDALPHLESERPKREVWQDLRAVMTLQAPRADPATEEVDRPVAPLTLLLVEDDPETAADLTVGLIEAGHRVVGPFQDAESAQAAAALHAIDLALLDINLSGEGDGVALAEALKSRWGVPTVFLSGDVTAAARHAGLSRGLVLKPYTLADVHEAIGRAGV